MVTRDEGTDRNPLEGRQGAGMKLSHQWSPLRARLGGGCCGVHVAEESLDLPQGDTPTSVTHLGEMGHVRGSPDLFFTHPHPLTPLTFPSLPHPQGLSEPISWQEGSPHPISLWSPKSRITYFDGQIFLAQGHHDLDRWENEAGFMAFHGCSHGILWRERG